MHWLISSGATLLHASWDDLAWGFASASWSYLKWGEVLPDARSEQVISGESISHQASLLVSILVRYSEIDSIRFHAKKALLAFSFMVKEQYLHEDIQAFRQMLLGYLETYASLSGHLLGQLGVVGHTHGEYTQVEVTRDVASLTREELSLLIQLIRQHFGTSLVIETEVGLRDEERLMQEELIEDILEDLKDGGPHRELVGFREAGRVMVFTKNRSTN